VEIRDTRDGHYTLEITASELFICRAALREVLYGFKFPDFEPRMGCTREMAASVLNSLPDPPSGEVERTVPQ
jgi:hypothetical protein